MRKIAFILCSLVLLFGQLSAQTRVITGKVLDEKGNPIPLVSVFVKGTRNGVTTATDGSFQLQVGPNTRRLVISSVGYTTEEVSVGSSANLTIILKINLGEIGEVVVTGYSRIKKSEYSGAATIVDKAVINDVPIATFDQILQGRVPGMLVTTGSGQPGESGSTRVQIRGQGSISGGNDPLYIVDGMPVEAENFAGLNAADFESIQVLKDAVATAQYGNRGSSGVVVVTTKRGRAGRSIVTYSGQAGITQPGKEKFDMANSAQILKIQENIGKFQNTNLPGWLYSPLNPANFGAPAAVLQENAHILDSLRSINTDWKKAFEREGTFQRHDLSITGGSENTKFYLTGGYYKEQGIALKSDLTRYSFRANVDHKADRLTLNLSSGASYSTANFIQSENSITLANSFAAVYLALPYQKLFNPDGSIATGQFQTGANAYEAQVEGSTQYNGKIKADFSLNATYDITKNIYIGGFLGMDYRQTTNVSTITPGTFFANTQGFPVGPSGNTPADTLGGGSYAPSISNYFEYVVRAVAGYRKVINEKHDLDLQVVSEYTKDHQSGFGYTGYGIDPNLLNTPAGVTQGTPDNLLIAGTSGSKQERALYAAMLLGKYSYMGKYTLNATFRRDGTSQLASDRRFQNFYSGGVTWNVLKEDFAQNWNKIDNLRFRVSYGEAADADGFFFGYFGYLPQYAAGTYAGHPTTVPSNAGNLDVTWERIKTLNAGIDFGFFKERISGSLDVYHKVTAGNIIPQQLSYTSGFGSIPVNAGTVLNKGVELSLNVDVVRLRDFRWSVGGNVSYNNNKVTSLGQVQQFEQGTELVKVGLPLGSHFIPKWAGVDAATGQGLYYDSSGKVTPVYNTSNSVAQFGTFNAPWIGGFNTGLYYKGFSLEAFFTYQQGFSIFNNQDFFQTNPAFVLQGYNVRTNVLSMWQKPGDVTDIQSPLSQRQFSSKDVQDASYLRFRNLTVAYNFPRALLSKTKVISTARLYVMAENLYTWTNWVGFDPEYANNIAQYAYPVPRTFTVGLTTSF
ncbi:MAG: SusC/RagA family TonB-linked outer membrane protein [Bacteroidota bacterium]|nr:SusC/RagA family TonB-linked outer membrane protein [Bacteroidota bacterium]MDP4217292.1 SusC/RagA family TonB-linked outer membrane protein [Bacteroidota bacterium]MDP4246169.1 SusC/RagA family TonB-linked outer membrane protein [Bacteroidota bacterium]MDP4253976.1 SusC/RagA family TonB-linked outer membrane protein [Bacteroidota bacterium]MDP4257994.1 SusC/RagA family TonB-linked outer membrane protein [Bacteroidota bacterium]